MALDILALALHVFAVVLVQQCDKSDVSHGHPQKELAVASSTAG